MSSYVQKTLATGEQIVHRANFNWTYSFWPMFWFALGLATVALYLFMQFVAGIPYETIRVGWWCAGIAGVAGVLIITVHFVVLVTTEIVVTTFRFVYKTGLISRRTQEVSLNKIEEITLRQSIWGRFLNYGQLVMRGTGVGVIELPDLDDPIGLRRIIESARSDMRVEKGPDDNG
ncbi:MAG: PH domain-containing protein [Pseudomonadota bacterium]